MSHKLIWLAILITAGCSGKSYKVANPVVGPAPPRIQPEQVALAQSETASEPSEDIAPVSFEDDSRRPLATTSVVAKVNGKPILAGDILDSAPERGALEQARSKLDDRQYRAAQEQIIRRDLPRYIEQKLMADAVRSKLKAEQLEGVEKQLDKGFEASLDEKRQRLKINSLAELEALLQAHGMSLETMRKNFGEQALAYQYIQAKMGDDAPVTRQELLEQYNASLKTYEQPLRVKWQQLQISIDKSGGSEQARRRLNEALARVERGESFADVVKASSDGPLAGAGGQWDWTQPESIANADVRKALETLRPGEISPVITTPSVVQVVRVNERQDAGHKPFNDVQEELRKKIIEDRRAARGKEIIDELMQEAVVESLLDPPLTAG